MKSIKAKEFIEEQTNEAIARDWMRKIMSKAVELAEEEMREKAIEAFKKDCKFKTKSWCNRDICDGCGHLSHFVNEFKKLLENE